MGRRRKKLALPNLYETLQTEALRMRGDPTLAESHLWQALRAGKLDGLRFRRQHPIGRFIVDFYCVQASLIVEVDGSIHAQQLEADEIRDDYLRAMGLKVIRFSNDEVQGDFESVLQRILNEAILP